MDKPVMKGAHEVTIEVALRKRLKSAWKKVKADPDSLIVDKGDKITWKMKKNDGPFLVVIKSQESPLDWSIRAAEKGKKITGRVREDARPGRYPYGIGAVDGTEFVYDDPEIIIKLPGM